jgi:hypothetical protein
MDMHSRVSVLLCILLVTATSLRADEVIRRDHVVVTYSDIDAEYATAIAKIVDAARSAAIKLGYDLPKKIQVSIHVQLRGSTHLFNDGDQSIVLTIRSKKDLRKPSDSGVYLIYGLCHEVAHLTMYHPMKERRWSTTASAEGWAHYLGSRLVDAVYEIEGEKLWPDPYDYREDGTKRLAKQRESDRPSPTVRGAGLWADLVAATGDKKVAQTFAGWGQAKIDLANPTESLARSLPNTKEVQKWWESASPLFVTKSAASPFMVKTAKRTELDEKPRELANDDGNSAGKRSIAGASHAVTFDAPEEGWYLTRVRVYGSRYGTAEAPEEKFTVFLLDDQYRRVAEFSFPYSVFERSDPKWVDLEMTPTLIPRTFVVGVDFQPTARRGVFVHYDAKASGKSATGIPGRKFEKFANGDWMIRVGVARPRN